MTLTLLVPHKIIHPDTIHSIAQHVHGHHARLLSDGNANELSRNDCAVLVQVMVSVVCSALADVGVEVLSSESASGATCACDLFCMHSGE